MQCCVYYVLSFRARCTCGCLYGQDQCPSKKDVRHRMIELEGVGQERVNPVSFVVVWLYYYCSRSCNSFFLAIHPDRHSKGTHHLWQATWLGTQSEVKAPSDRLVTNPLILSGLLARVDMCTSTDILRLCNHNIPRVTKAVTGVE